MRHSSKRYSARWLHAAIAVNAAWEVSRVDLDYTVASLQTVDAIIEAGQVGPQLERCRRVEQLGPLEPGGAKPLGNGFLLGYEA